MKADGESEGAVTPDLGVSLLSPRSTGHPGAWIFTRSQFHGQRRRVETSKCCRLGGKLENAEIAESTHSSGKNLQAAPRNPSCGVSSAKASI